MNLRKFNKIFLSTYIKIRRLLDLKEDFDEMGARDSIIENIEFKSGNAWGLIFAILVASVGLHVNSTAVIIGAMLISPLMGPIVGAGFSLAVHDFENLKRSVLNLSYAVAISIITSALFFSLAPSSGAHSELIARTQPNFYDVLIALFGGAAGIVASTRKSKSNAIPGVAIATALMPPLCTVGYGLANFTPTYSIGALYLFLINTLFIFLSTYVFVRFLNFRTEVDKDPERDKRIHKWMGFAAILIVIPSIFMVWYLHKRTSFEVGVNSFIENEIASHKLIVGKSKVNFSIKQSSVNIKIFGDTYSESEILNLTKILNEKYGINDVDLTIKNEEPDVLKEADLDQKYLSKQEFLNFQQSRLKNEMNELIESINTFNQFESGHYGGNSYTLAINNESAKPIIEVQWAKKPKSNEIKKAEVLISQILLKHKYSFLHK
ncbi:MAG: DUF389 domain-containing protein [Bdellovibrionaceae bacterium]|nr:DUF389 domain-containing protein [Pseudobdellovibrionaceae bacterium]